MENLIIFSLIAISAVFAYRNLRGKSSVPPSQPPPQQPATAQNQTPKTLWDKIKADIMVIAIVAIALGTLELIAWVRIEPLWRLIYDSLQGFIIFNLGVITAAWLGRIMEVDKEGKKTDKPHPVASRAAKTIWIIVALSLISSAPQVLDHYFPDTHWRVWQKKIEKIEIPVAAGQKVTMPFPERPRGLAHFRNEGKPKNCTVTFDEDATQKFFVGEPFKINVVPHRMEFECRDEDKIFITIVLD